MQTQGRRTAGWIGLGLAAALLTGCKTRQNPVTTGGSVKSGGSVPVVIPQPAPAVAVNPWKDWKPRARSLEHGPEGLQKVALTFDAGSTDEAVEPILKVLAEHHVHCTFFLTGKFCEKFPKSCRAIADAGMELGNHSYSHPKFTRLSSEKLLEQLTKAEEEIEATCGRGAKPLFRFPYGDSNLRVVKEVAEAGYQPIYWSLDSLDAFGKPKTADFVADRFLKRLKAGDITLMHVSCPTSAEALPRIFDRLNQMGIQVVPVSELLLAQKPAVAHGEPSRSQALRKF